MSASSNPVDFAESSEEVLKLCPRCPEGQNHKPLNEFSNDRSKRDGKYYICKECDVSRCKEYYAKRKRVSEEGAVGENDGDDDDGYDETEEVADDLYVMQNSRISAEVKIGRSINPDKRRRDLQASQNYRINISAVFPGAGHLEPLVHDMLAYCRVRDVPGREWFKCTPQTAFGAIGTALGG